MDRASQLSAVPQVGKPDMLEGLGRNQALMHMIKTRYTRISSVIQYEIIEHDTRTEDKMFPYRCSSTASTSNEPGPDVADYPYDTVPNKAPRVLATLSLPTSGLETVGSGVWDAGLRLLETRQSKLGAQ